jgi:TatD DNase family protein
MNLIDTHTHLYLPHFESDIDQVIQNAADNRVEKLLLPNIDLNSTGPMLGLCKQFPGQCFPMLGLHPTSVKDDYKDQLRELESIADNEKFIAIGETGMDAYWDTTYLKEQEDSFITQLEWAKKMNLPVVIHSRNTLDRILTILKSQAGNNLRGVFHAYSGSIEQLADISKLGFKIGIGGVVTYKKSNLADVVRAADLESILLETDSPYLTPVPFRGKRNESAYLVHVALRIAEIKDVPFEEIAAVTSANANKLFNLSS